LSFLPVNQYKKVIRLATTNATPGTAFIQGQVNDGNELLVKTGKPNFSEGTLETINTEVPPTSFSP